MMRSLVILFINKFELTSNVDKCEIYIDLYLNYFKISHFVLIRHLQNRKAFQ